MHGDYVEKRLSKIPIFNTLILIPMMKNTTSQLTVVLITNPNFNLTRTIFSHIKFFKYQNGMFNLKNVTTTHSYPSLVGYLMTSLNIYF